MQITQTKAVLFAVLCLTVITMQTIAGPVPRETWFPSGLDVVRDPLTGRLGVPEFYGETIVSGSANSPVIWQDPLTRDAHLYIGASNGGVYLRRYSFAEDRWSDRWIWVSRPGTGYTCSQSIGVLSISPDGRYLAVGEGNASNYQSLGVPGYSLQIGAIQPDGMIEWLETSSVAQAVLNLGFPIRSLHWQEQGLVATTWNQSQLYLGKNGQFVTGGTLLLVSQSDAGGIATATIAMYGSWNLMIDSITESANAPLLIAGHNTQPVSGSYSNLVGVVRPNGSVTPLSGTDFRNYLQGLETSQLKIARISLYPHLVDGVLTAFVGSYASSGGKDMISRIDRLTIDPLTYELIDFSGANVQGKIGTNQAANDGFYGNFSLSANPLDPQGLEVFSGGNAYGGINAYTYAGGLVGVGFGAKPASIDYLYGPLGSNGQIGDPSPGAPHADSRQITYYETPKGWSLVQSDDGGIWQLPLQAEGVRWWSSLSAPGLNTLENIASDWNSITKSVVAAYQDNAAAVGRFGSAYPYMQNVWMGDGQLAFFDDAEPTALGKFTSAYVSSYQYLASEAGNIQRIALDESGFFKSYDDIGMYLDFDGQVIPFSESFAFTSQNLPVPFSAPLAANAYRSGDIVMAGRFNVYETTGVDPRDLPDSLIFKPLFDWNADPEAPAQLNTYWVNSIDNQGSPQNTQVQTAFDSLYVGLQIAGPGGNDVRFSGIYGRKAGDTASLGPVYQAVLGAGPIVAIAHRPSQNQGDTVYWLQSGIPVGNGRSNNQAELSLNSAQMLGIHSANGQNRMIPLTELGLAFSPSDPYKAQSLVYVPAVNGHDEYLVIGSQEGAWIAPLNGSAEPASFTRMNWQGLPASTPPGSPNVTMKYDPQDDLLVTTQLGQGVWLYSFTGQVDPAKVSDQKLILTDTQLQQQAKPDLDKRGNQMNTGLFVQLNDHLMDPNKAYDVDLVFHDFAQWQNNLELLTPTVGAVGKTPASYNLLDDSGQARFHATLNNGQLSLPIHFEPGVTKMVITVNIKEFPEFVPSFSLNFTASLKGSSGSATGHLVLASGSPAYTVYIPSGRSVLDPFSPEFDPQNKSLPRFRYGSEKWVTGPIFHIPGEGYSDDDIVYVGTHGNKVKTGKGADLLYIDGNTTGPNQLSGGPGKNQFRLVSTYGDLPTEPQWVMDFKPSRDAIGLVGVTYEDLTFNNSPQGAELHVFGQRVGIFRNIGKQALKRKKNFIFYP
jgi:hypothetical protein